MISSQPTQSQITPPWLLWILGIQSPLFLWFGTLHFFPSEFNCSYSVSPYFTQISVIHWRQGTRPQFLQFQILTCYAFQLGPPPLTRCPLTLFTFKFTFLFFFFSFSNPWERCYSFCLQITSHHVLIFTSVHFSPTANSINYPFSCICSLFLQFSYSQPVRL